MGVFCRSINFITGVDFSKNDTELLKNFDISVMDLQWFASAEEEGRTEEPTEHKLRKAREEGRVAKSQELTSSLIMFFCVLTLIILAPWLLKKFVEILKFYLTRCCELEVYDGIIASAFYSYYFKMILPIAIVALVLAIAGNIIQNRGFIFSTKPITPDFSKIMPRFGEYFKKTLFSLNGAFNVAKSIIKVVIIFFIAFFTIKGDLENLLKMQTVSLWTGLSHLAWMVAKMLIIVSIVFLVIAIPDYFMQRKQFMESMKMSKEEIKREYKELEGDPQIKGKIRSRMQQMLTQNLPKTVRESDVIITNPTHYAVALKYDAETMPGPMLTAKGEDANAQVIKRLAKDNNVPILENRPLARTLYTEVEIGAIIPDKYWMALTNIYKVVYELNEKSKK